MTFLYLISFVVDTIVTDRVMLRICVDKCYSPDNAISSAYFLALVENFEHEFLPLPEPLLLLLIIFQYGSRSANIRRASRRLLLLWKAHVREEVPGLSFS